ncbi:hypothetical protein QQS21_000057 [Conoideocrella luteorostrata]|uniref:Fe2OG dioxygenase domain-containing protein n=1 Tax=Conoideocrella luteorostrata TaxID=1105319 RepID=A0AAJ0CZS1_9HYPO|nr:hypothetical protein QQS21_000057 [Conoideocrella luteorostrata]
MSSSPADTVAATSKSSEFTQPPFPDNVPTAPLLRLSLGKLMNREADEVSQFTRACEDLGFFYLDLRGPGDAILEQSGKLFDVGNELFDLPLQEKKKYNFEKFNSYLGYKHMGANIADKDGNLDRNEFYNVGKDDIFELCPKWPAPDVLESRRSLIKTFMASAYSIVSLVLELLNDHLSLPTGTLQSMHRLEGHGGDQVRFIKAPPQPQDDRSIALGEHTDFGSVTVLFNRLGGLQILPPGQDAEWCYVKPLQGHAIINLGDALVKFTNGLLRSNIHRVVSPPGEQVNCTRYSLVYFNRPEDHVILRRLANSDRIPRLPDGVVEEEVTSKDWIIRRALGSRISLHGKDALDFSLHRGTEAISQRAH